MPSIVQELAAIRIVVYVRGRRQCARASLLVNSLNARFVGLQLT